MAMNFTVESWEPTYGTATGDGVRGGANDPSSRPVDTSVERRPDAWTPIDPTVGSSGTHGGDVIFVDGVRRIDARVWIDEPPDDNGRITSRPGVCASVAAGSVRCRPGRAEIDEAVVRRGLYTATEHAEGLELRPRDPLSAGGSAIGTYELRPVADDSDEAMYFGVHQHMTELEVDLSSGLDGSDDALVVFDGPLNDRASRAVTTHIEVGYIKTQHVQYLPPDLHGLIGSLTAGQRTPVFHIGGRFPVWSWYLRLPTVTLHAMSGIVRLELSAADGIGRDQAERAALQADAVSLVLPRFASEPHKDGRAPQNLYPIAGLERQLRHLMGDSRVLERALRRSTGPLSSMGAL